MELKEGETKYCINCGEKILRKAVICPKCGNAQTSFDKDYYSKKNKVVAAILAFVMGPFGAHWFYLGKIKYGILLLIYGIVSCIVCVTLWIYAEISSVDINTKDMYSLLGYIVIFAPCVIGFVNGIKFFGMTDEQFNEQYVKSN